jgi:hypothetical protein
VNGRPVCATPLSFGDKATHSSLTSLFKKSLFGEKEMLEILEKHLVPCLEQYFIYIADSFRSLFFHQSKRHALQVCRKVQAILSASVDPKLKLIEGNEELSSAAAEAIRHRVHQENDAELIFYQAASYVVLAIIEVIEYCLGVRDTYDQGLSLAQAALATVPEDTPGLIDLHECIRFLTSPAQRDTLTPLADTYDAETSWGADLRQAAHFISHILSLMNDFGKDSLFVFVTYHMGVYASEEFYRQFKEFGCGEQSRTSKTHVVVLTGFGRQAHITLSILAKIWISDVYVIYVPNSLGAFDKPEKTLRRRNDWFIEELYYGFETDAFVHFVIAKPTRPESERVLDKLLQQIEEYEFTSIDPLIRAEKCRETGLVMIQSVRRHLRSKTFTTHQPGRRSLSDDDRRNLRDGVLVPALKNRMRDRVRALRLGLIRDHWGVVQAIHAASWNKNTRKRRWATTEEVTERFSWKRLDGYPVRASWVRKVIREHLSDLVITVGSMKVPLVKEGPRIGKQKTVKFTLDSIIDAILKFYRLPVSPSVLQREFLQIVTERGW